MGELRIKVLIVHNTFTEKKMSFILIILKTAIIAARSKIMGTEAVK